jgi:NAD(P)-dependent dehydrogenase (short-subunit alcohol dehydrogenase family)
MTIESSPGLSRPLALITGVGRTIGIGAGIAARLAASGWDIAFTYWTAYDQRMPWGTEPRATGAIERTLSGHGAAVAAIEADLADAGSPALIFDEAERRLGNVTALVMCHCESVDSGLLDTNLESFDRHFAVNARASWLLIREFGRRFRGPHGTGRIISLTSDATVGNLPYGAARPPWTASPSRPHASWNTSASPRTRSTPARSTPDGCPTTCGSTSSATHRWAASAPPKTPPTWSSSSAPPRAAGSTASSS